MPEALRRVLFVDDDRLILDALQNLMRKQRSRWDMHFALGGVEAIALFAVKPFDVVVSDMRMPGMDGAELLAWVREHHPAARRIVLSGYAEPAAVERALTVAHQFLCKPCPPPALIDAIAAV